MLSHRASLETCKAIELYGTPSALTTAKWYSVYVGHTCGSPETGSSRIRRYASDWNEGDLQLAGTITSRPMNS